MLKKLWHFLCALFVSTGCGSYRKEDSTTKNKNGTKASRFPVVLAHGMLGSDRILFSHYFYQIPERFSLREGQLVFMPRVSPANGVAYRARQLARQIDEILAETKAEKVHIIAHSMGGLDARYLISTLGYGDRIASLTTIGTPHRGSAIADLAHAMVDTTGEAAFHLFEKLTGASSKDVMLQSWELDLKETIRNLTTSYLETFNEENPDDERVAYQSWAGRTFLFGGRHHDSVDTLFLGSFFILSQIAGPNDGLVTVESAQWGEFGGIIEADHLDMIGQLFGSTKFNYLRFYDGILNDLIEKGM